MKKLFLVISIFALCSAAYAQQKFALVIGNGAYTNITKLNNPVNDANDMAAALTGLGFTVDKVTNGSLEQMESAVLRLKARLSASRNTYGFLFYAGHGVQSNGENYLIPVNANIQTENSLRRQAISVQEMLDELNDARNELNIVVLDACRDNPFPWKRSGSRGLQVVGNQPSDSIIVFATSAGSTAADGAGSNGLFTSHLLNNLKKPGLEVTEVFRLTMGDVASSSGNQQRPAIYNQFTGLAYLGSRPAPVTQPAPAVTVTPPAPAPVVPVTPPASTVTIVPALPPTPVQPATVIGGEDGAARPFTSTANFEEWLKRQPDNSVNNPYAAKLNINGLFGVAVILKDNEKKFVSLDFSGSAFFNIENSAFRNCYNLTNITMSNNVINIGDWAFQNCFSLASVIIPNSVKTVGSGTFENCNRLASVTIGNGVTSIGDSAFYGCTNLQSIIIPSSVKSFGNKAFIGTNLTRVTFQGTIPSDGFPRRTSRFNGNEPFTFGLREAFYATYRDIGTPGTYVKGAGSSPWVLQY
jgi:hypothetical protein